MKKRENSLARIEPFNPLDKRNLAESIANQLFLQPIHPLPPEPFIGAGVYALYYTGDFPEYAPVKCDPARCDIPIYVGKAVPAGARKGGFGLGEDPGTALSSRLHDHANSICSVSNLNIGDFRCRFLVVDDIWIPLAESILIETFRPLWNKLLDGFGNHDPGAGRYNQKRSPWDVLHPGRAWADKLRPCSLSLAEIRELLKKSI